MLFDGLCVATLQEQASCPQHLIDPQNDPPTLGVHRVRRLPVQIHQVSFFEAFQLWQELARPRVRVAQCVAVLCNGQVVKSRWHDFLV
jgi:hypothetical protein